MNDAQLAGLPINDEDYLRIELRAAFGNDPEAQAIVDSVRQRTRIRADTALEVWGYRESKTLTASPNNVIPFRPRPIAPDPDPDNPPAA